MYRLMVHSRFPFSSKIVIKAKDLEVLDHIMTSEVKVYLSAHV